MSGQTLKKKQKLTCTVSEHHPKIVIYYNGEDGNSTAEKPGGQCFSPAISVNGNSSKACGHHLVPGMRLCDGRIRIQTPGLVRL